MPISVNDDDRFITLKKNVRVNGSFKFNRVGKG